MDSLTHIVLGAAIGEAMLGKKIGKKGMLWGALANSLPDIDVLANFFTNPVNALIIHRGITHSFFFALLISPLLAYLLNKKFLDHSLTYKNWLLFFLTAIVAHDVIDLFTAYGTGLLEPFSHQRFSTNSIFVADPFYTLPLLVSFIILLILKAISTKRRVVNRAAIILSTGYLIFTFINKNHVQKIVSENLSAQNIPQKDFVASPAPLNNILWYVIAKNDTGYFTGYYSDFDADKKIAFHYIPRNDVFLENFHNDPVIDKLKCFSHGYYTITKNETGEIFFNDMRFGQAAGWIKPDSKFVFRYGLINSSDNVTIIKRTDIDVSFSEAFRTLIKRIKGK